MAVPTLQEVKDHLGIDFNERDDQLQLFVNSLEQWLRDRSTLEASDPFPDALKANFLIAFEQYWEKGNLPSSTISALGNYASMKL